MNPNTFYSPSIHTRLGNLNVKHDETRHPKPENFRNSILIYK